MNTRTHIISAAIVITLINTAGIIKLVIDRFSAITHVKHEAVFNDSRRPPAGHNIYIGGPDSDELVITDNIWFGNSDDAIPILDLKQENLTVSTQGTYNTDNGDKNEMDISIPKIIR